jgi:preprotein translocase subunit YajC
MNSFVLPFLIAAPAGGAEAGAGGLFTSFIPLILIIAIFYFLIIRPQGKKRKETERMLSSLRKGDKVITIGGLHGTVQTVRETTVIIKADDNVKLEFLRSAVANIVTASKEKTEKIEDDSEDQDESSDTGD